MELKSQKVIAWFNFYCETNQQNQRTPLHSLLKIGWGEEPLQVLNEYFHLFSKPISRTLHLILPIEWPKFYYLHLNKDTFCKFESLLRFYFFYTYLKYNTGQIIRHRGSLNNEYFIFPSFCLYFISPRT